MQACTRKRPRTPTPRPHREAGARALPLSVHLMRRLIVARRVRVAASVRGACNACNTCNTSNACNACDAASEQARDDRSALALARSRLALDLLDPRRDASVVWRPAGPAALYRKLRGIR